MQEKDPLSYSMLTYIWIFALAMFGGVANYVRKMNGQAMKFSLFAMLGDLVVSAFAGLVAFFLCESAAVNPMAEAALVGMSGHMGSRSIFALEQMILSRRDRLS